MAVCLFAAASALGLGVRAPEAQAAPVKIACIGEHTTHSHDFPPTNRESQPVGMQEYPARLQALLGQAYQVRNFGDCCATVMQGYPAGAETHPYVKGSNANDGPGYNESLTFLPDIVVIGSWGRQDWGLNKAPGQVFSVDAFSKGFDDLISRYQNLASHPKIFISLPIPILFGQGDIPDEGVKTSDMVPVFKSIAAKYSLPTIDLYSKFLNHKELFKQPPDPKGEGEHVNADGLAVIAETVYQAITAAAGGVDAGADAPAQSADASSGVDAPTPPADGTGTAGAPGAGGVGGSGGGLSSPDGAAGGQAGSPGGLTGTAGSSGSPGGGSSGCSCALRGNAADDAAGWYGFLALLLVGARRRRQCDR